MYGLFYIGGIFIVLSRQTMFLISEGRDSLLGVPSAENASSSVADTECCGRAALGGLEAFGEVFRV